MYNDYQRDEKNTLLIFWLCIKLVNKFTLDNTKDEGVLKLEKLESEGKYKKLNIQQMIAEKKKSANIGNTTEKLIPGILFGIAAISVFTTIGILITLLSETILFFKEVPFLDFFTGTKLKPLGDNAVFGVLPLLTGTLISTCDCDDCGNSYRCHDGCFLK